MAVLGCFFAFLLSEEVTLLIFLFSVLFVYVWSYIGYFLCTLSNKSLLIAWGSVLCACAAPSC